jgi:hypothetical protein
MRKSGEIRITFQRNEKTIAICAGVWIAIVSYGMAQYLPAITDKSILGTWEGVYAEEPRVFVIDVRAKDECVVVMALGRYPDAGVFVYRCTSIVVRARGAFNIKAEDNGDVIQIKGKGEGVSDYPAGILRATVSLPALDGVVTTFKNVVFQKREFGYFDHLRIMMDNAQRRLLVERGRPPNEKCRDNVPESNEKKRGDPLQENTDHVPAKSKQK